MEIDDACLDNPVDIVHLDDSPMLERGDMQQLSCTVLMTASDTPAKKARKRSNKEWSETNTIV